MKQKVVKYLVEYCVKVNMIREGMISNTETGFKTNGLKGV